MRPRQLAAPVWQGWILATQIKSDLLAGSLSAIIQLTVVVSIWSAAGSADLSSRLVTYLVVARIVWLIVDAKTEVYVANIIFNGELSYMIARPVSFPTYVLCETLGFSASNVVFQVAPVVAFAAIFYPPHASTSGALPAVLVTLVIAYLVAFFFNFAIGIVAAWVDGLWTIPTLKAAVIAIASGVLIPVEVMPHAVGAIVEASPVAAMVHTPVTIALGQVSGTALASALAYQVTWLIVAFGLAALLWRQVLRRLTTAGD